VHALLEEGQSTKSTLKDLGTFRALARGAAASLEASRQRIDDLNV
jgi:hypothetical protein